MKLLSTLLFFLSSTAFVTNAAPSVKKFPNLRIMPLGDSITRGSGSTGIVGYRGPLRSKLLAFGKEDGSIVDMIGTLAEGNMTDNNHEGHRGEYIEDINKYWKLSIKSQPNVVLVHAGTNNMWHNKTLDTAINYMRYIIDGILKQSPGVTILVAPVIWGTKPILQQNRANFNPLVEDLINRRLASGKRVLPVYTNMTASDLYDGVHPNDVGYEKFATAWYNAILDAHSRGWIKEPIAIAEANTTGMGVGYEGYSGYTISTSTAATSKTASDAQQTTTSSSTTLTTKPITPTATGSVKSTAISTKGSITTVTTSSSKIITTSSKATSSSKASTSSKGTSTSQPASSTKASNFSAPITSAK